MRWLLAFAVAAVAIGGTAQGQDKKPEVSFEEKLLATIPEGVEAGLPDFAKDGRSVAYRVQGGGKEWLVINEKKGEEFDNVYPRCFSPAGGVFAYEAKKDGKSFMVVGDAKSQAYDSIGSPVFSPDGTKVAFGAKKGRELWWKVMSAK